jgi:hypothetical protein
MDNPRKVLKWSIVLVALVAGVSLYYLLDPADYDFFPSCPFYTLTGYKCPGCGSQRAIHHLLNLDIPSAFRENALLVTALPYILGAFLFDYTKLGEKYPRVKKTLYGLTAIIIACVIAVGFWIFRNL